MQHNKNKIIALLIIITLVFSFLTIYAYSRDFPTVSAVSAALYQPDLDKFLYLKNEKARLPMASTTKIMTALIAIESLVPEEEITIDSRSVGIEGSSVYLEEGEVLTAKDLIYCLLLSSANDAAVALAVRIAGSVEDFSSLMNQKATEIGLSDTCYQNPHGLDSKDHYTTARDLCILGAEAMKNPNFKEITSKKNYTVISSLKKRTLVNHNKLLSSYDGCLGIKTGYTKKSGRSLVSYSERNAIPLVFATINAPDDWRDHKTVLDYGYSLVEKRSLLSENEYQAKIPVIGGDIDKISLTNKDRIDVILETNSHITREIHCKRYATAPISKGDCLGFIIYKCNGIIIASTEIISDDDVQQIKRKGLFHLNSDL